MLLFRKIIYFYDKLGSMSESTDIEKDVESFVLSLGRSVDATPHENKNIHAHLMKQIEFGAKKKPEEYLESPRGYEPVMVYEKSGLTVKKRLFHPKDAYGVDFTLTKYKKGDFLGVTAVQVKRNHRNTFFEFRNRELAQLKNFLEYWGSGYYLFIDETSNPPANCFVSASELHGIIIEATNNPHILKSPKRVVIPNNDIRMYCRGLKLFYDFFYSCSRGQKMPPEAFVERVREYANKVYKIVVELLLI